MVTGPDRVVQIVGIEVPIIADRAGNLLGAKAMDALQALEMEFHVMHLALRVDQLEGMHSISIHMAIRVGHAFHRI